MKTRQERIEMMTNMLDDDFPADHLDPEELNDIEGEDEPAAVPF